MMFMGGGLSPTWVLVGFNYDVVTVSVGYGLPPLGILVSLFGIMMS